MKHLRSLAIALLLPCFTSAGRGASAVPSAPSVTALRTEYAANPIGIDAREPRLSWRIEGKGRGIAQTAYRIQVASSPGTLEKERDLLWDSGIVESTESVLVPYRGPAPGSSQRLHWRVRIRDAAGSLSDWSNTAFWETGLLQESDWEAEWIEHDVAEDPRLSLPAHMLRREFTLPDDVTDARVHVTCQGLYEMEINGKRVGDQYFTPGWTSYGKRLQYQTYDITSLLRKGTNAIGVTIGNGWYRGDMAWRSKRNTYGTKLALLVQLSATGRDGQRQEIISDAEWKSSTGPIRMAEIYNGETYDARLEKTGWSSPGYDDSDWKPVRTAPHPKSRLVASAAPPVRRIEELRPVKIWKTPAGETVADMGQNMVGWVRLKVRGPAGTTITLRHAEVLDGNGNFYTSNLRMAKQTVRYTLKGGGPETYEPRFTFMGFRYVAIDGYPGMPDADDLTGVVLHSEMAPTSSFETSKPLVNQLHRNIVWGQKGNFLDVPTDCPQRDERLGWTGDAQAFARTAAFNMDVSGFFAKWMRDVAADQLPSGSVPWVVPDVLTLQNSQNRPQSGSAGWGDVATIVPWTMYLSYGDRRILETQYPSMIAWVEFIRKRAGEDLIWSEDFTYGDWLAFASAQGDYPGATTGKDLIATAMFAHSTDLVQRTARLLGKDADAAKYGELLERIKAAFRREFVTETGRIGENTQTAYALTLQFDLLPPGPLRDAAARRLAEEVRSRRHLTTGFLGTPYLCHVLSRHGYLDEAYLLLNREDYPSWLYPVKKGATTIWERWDGIKPDGSFQNEKMNSFNHYAYGAIGEWMYRVMAGIEIDPAAPGYKHVLIQPRPGGGFTRVSASHLSPYGRVASAWRKDGTTFGLIVEIPPNTTATVRLPGARLEQVREGPTSLAEANGLSDPRQDGPDVVVKAGSGTYDFTYPIAR